MVKPDLVTRKVALATRRLADAEALLARPAEAPLVDVQAQDLATFYLFLGIQECIDLAAHWVADAGWGPAEDVASTFDLLAARGAISAELARGLRAAAALRNRIAHGYETVDHARLQDEYPQGIATLRRFLSAVAAAAGA